MEFEKIQFGFIKKFPLILQTEAAECGLACLAMISSFYGLKIDLNTLRYKFSPSLKGMTLQDIVKLSAQLHLTSRPLKLEIDELIELKLPAILHWDFNHYVVLKKISSRGVIIYDPASGKRTVSHSELSKHFTGIAIEVFTMLNFQKGEKLQHFNLSNLFNRVSGVKRSLFLILLLAIGLELLSLLEPIGLQIAIDQAVISQDLDLVSLITVGLIIILISQTFINFCHSWIAMTLSTKLSLQWAIGLFSHLLRLPLIFFENRHVGDIIFRFKSLDSVQHTLTLNLVEAIINSFMAVGLLSMMLIYSKNLALSAILVISIYTMLRFFFYNQYREFSEERIIHQARENSHFIETIRGAASIKSLGIEVRRQTSWIQKVAKTTNSDLKVQRIDIFFDLIKVIIFGLGRLSTLWLGARAVINNDITMGMFMAYSFYQEQFFSRSNQLVSTVFNLKMLKLHALRLADIALAKPEKEQNTAQQNIEKTNSNIFFEANNICFKYGTGESHILNGITFRVKPGESLAIIGPSGCGKTTLLKILAGLISPSQGEVKYQGLNIDKMGIFNYRACIGCVLQEDQMFSGTITENISSFDTAPNQLLVEQCAQLANLHKEILDMPMSYSSFVGDMGSLLSGGQKQRLYLARALYRKPSILFLDESTSNLDEDNENTINKTISKLGISRIIVAHRPNTINYADKIIDLSKSKE